MDFFAIFIAVRHRAPTAFISAPVPRRLCTINAQVLQGAAIRLSNMSACLPGDAKYPVESCMSAFGGRKWKKQRTDSSKSVLKFFRYTRAVLTFIDVFFFFPPPNWGPRLSEIVSRARPRAGLLPSSSSSKLMPARDIEGSA